MIDLLIFTTTHFALRIAYLHVLGDFLSIRHSHNFKGKLILFGRGGGEEHLGQGSCLHHYAYRRLIADKLVCQIMS